MDPGQGGQGKAPEEAHRRFSLIGVPEERDCLTCLGNKEDSMWLEPRQIRGEWLKRA